jgi:hypothetical protein
VRARLRGVIAPWSAAESVSGWARRATTRTPREDASSDCWCVSPRSVFVLSGSGGVVRGSREGQSQLAGDEDEEQRQSALGVQALGERVSFNGRHRAWGCGGTTTKRRGDAVPLLLLPLLLALPHRHPRHSPSQDPRSRAFDADQRRETVLLPASLCLPTHPASLSLSRHCSLARPRKAPNTPAARSASIFRWKLSPELQVLHARAKPSPITQARRAGAAAARGARGGAVVVAPPPPPPPWPGGATATAAPPQLLEPATTTTHPLRPLGATHTSPPCSNASKSCGSETVTCAS